MIEDKKIWVVTEVSAPKGSRNSEDIGGRLSGSQSTETTRQVRTNISVETLKKEMEALLSNIDDILSCVEKKVEQQQTSMPLDEVEQKC
jgi:hypothetical protein